MTRFLLTHSMNNSFYDLLNIANKMPVEITWPSVLSWREQYDTIYTQIEHKYYPDLERIYFYVKQNDTLLTHVINSHDEYMRRITYFPEKQYYVFYISRIEVNAFNTILVHAVNGKDVQIDYSEMVRYLENKLIL